MREFLRGMHMEALAHMVVDKSQIAVEKTIFEQILGEGGEAVGTVQDVAMEREINTKPPPHSMWTTRINHTETLLNMLDDINAFALELHGTWNTGHGIHDDSGPAMAAWGALKEESPDSYFVYPHLRELSFPPPRLDMHALLEHELIATKFGTEFQKNGLRPYMTSYTKIVEGKPLEWHLVNSICIYGSFEVLASGAVALVDIPGLGDANKARTKRTEEYLKTAEVVILVADIKRAADDQNALEIQAVKAAKRSIKIIKTLGEGYRWHSYRALMRREGEWGSVDLNEDLVQGMLDGAVSSLWHKFFTDFIRSELRLLVVTISDKADTAILSIKNRAQQMATISQCVNNACNLIHPRDMINPAREAYLEFCGTFKGLLRKELEDNYHVMASEFGPGMFQRMKDLNEMQFGAETAEELYAKLVERVMTAIRMARNKAETALDEALGRLYSSIDRSLVCMQGNDQISKVKRRNMQKFLEKECNKPLAEVMTITGQNMPMLH
ncbi:hypothetical protein BD769DRAFT_1682534 [Suillus cothurnatus]|nr:hypothetical protein BD769DRAFT_1682534 [Suillus cothurnatus]